MHLRTATFEFVVHDGDRQTGDDGERTMPKTSWSMREVYHPTSSSPGVIRAAWHEAGRYLHLCDNVGGAAGEQRDAIFNAMKATSRQPACSPASSPPFTGRQASTRRHLHCPRGCRQTVWRHLHPWRGGRRAARRHLQRHEDDVATAGVKSGVISIFSRAAGEQRCNISDKAAGEQHGAIINATSTRLPMCSLAPSPTQSRRCRDDRRIA